MVETTKLEELTKLIKVQDTSLSWLRHAAFLLRFIPHGWVCQNMAVYVKAMNDLAEAFSPETGLIRPSYLSSAQALATNSFAPYSFLARIAIPNFKRVVPITAYNQTLVNEAYVACALERYRLAHQQYPNSLNELVPQFADKISCDIFGGQPLHYRKTDDGKYLLYSIGWNEKDDGGQRKSDPGKDQDQGDIVWQDVVKR
jgi:hypothetical protein